MVKSISRSGLSSMLAFHCQRVGEAKLSAHSFRKYFQTQLEAAGVSPNWIDQIIGHRLINSRDSYSLPSDQQLREAYEKAYPQLRVYPEEVEVEERISKLEADIEERNRTIANLLVNGDQKESKITELERKMAGLEALLKRALPLVEQLGHLSRRNRLSCSIHSASSCSSFSASRSNSAFSSGDKSSYLRNLGSC